MIRVTRVRRDLQRKHVDHDPIPRIPHSTGAQHCRFISARQIMPRGQCGGRMTDECSTQTKIGPDEFYNGRKP
ncbi:hypothetical protein CY34DRAFT_801971 [Suillus luteus UH-Slu-Lm8-n1]|uniref:Uncharacterized protein n=1 Tax=Suillus luteus UH-Slu-Lm8-n1 TaxID=930992 RepID=A0A0D0BG94_9AGAM|nr:hypothetical protein CY34DRAFT_801971 [Suillus luteus UH-Slu-Lm8-n1]